MDWNRIVLEILFNELLEKSMYGSGIGIEKTFRLDQKQPITKSSSKDSKAVQLKKDSEEEEQNLTELPQSTYQIMKEEEEKIRKFAPKYTLHKKNPLLYEFNYTFVPEGAQVKRVPQTLLGYGVLGMAFPGLKLIYVLETLQGNDFDEVLKHERNHILHPWMTEQQIRFKTKNELYYTPRYH